MFGSLSVDYMIPLESWKINWCFYDDICNVDIMTAASDGDMKIIGART